MTEITRINQDLPIVQQILKENFANQEIVSVKQDNPAVMGHSGNESKRYRAQTATGEIVFYAKIFKHGRKEILADRLRREVKAVELIQRHLPGKVYEILTISQNPPAILTKEIEGSVPLSTRIKAEDSSIDVIEEGLKMLIDLHKIGVAHGDAQARNLQSIPVDELKSGGIKAIDLEDAVFADEVSQEEFREWMKSDIGKFLTSIFVFGSYDIKDIDKYTDLYRKHKKRLLTTMQEAYGDFFGNDSERERFIHSAFVYMEDVMYGPNLKNVGRR